MVTGYVHYVREKSKGIVYVRELNDRRQSFPPYWILLIKYDLYVTIFIPPNQMHGNHIILKFLMEKEKLFYKYTNITFSIVFQKIYIYLK